MSSLMRARRYGEGYLYVTRNYFISIGMIEIRSLQPLQYSHSTGILYTQDTCTGGGRVVDPHLPSLIEIEQLRTKRHKNITPSFDG